MRIFDSVQGSLSHPWWIGKLCRREHATATYYATASRYCRGARLSISSLGAVATNSLLVSIPLTAALYSRSMHKGAQTARRGDLYRWSVAAWYFGL